jgi:hypothetical protein
MSLPAFIQSLFESGEARVPTIADARAFGDETGPVLVPPDERDDAIAALVRYEAVVRAGWPMRVPAFDIEVGLQSAAFVYQAARLILSRHVPGEVVAHVLERDGIASDTPAAHYSVDLTGRYLPDLFRMAGGRLTDDPLADRLSRFGARWPLSSIGMPGTIPDAQRLDTVLGHPSLHASYIDRVLELSDTPRLAAPRVAEAAHRVISEHPGVVSRSVQQAIEQQLVLSSTPTNEELA